MIRTYTNRNMNAKLTEELLAIPGAPGYKRIRRCLNCGVTEAEEHILYSRGHPDYHDGYYCEGCSPSLV